MSTWYKAGTVALNNGSTTVTGTGTAFVANVQIGEGFNAPDGRQYEIANVVSDTVLTLGKAYLGTNVSGAAYEIAPFRGRDTQILAQIGDLLSSFTTVRDGIGQGLFPDGSVSAPGFRFASDQDTGVFRPASNAIGLVTGGVERARLTEAGNLALGWTVPRCRLDVRAPTLGTSAGDSVDSASFGSAVGSNETRVVTRSIRATNGSEWTTARLRIQAIVDTTDKSWIDLIPYPELGGLAFGEGATVLMRIGASGHITPGADNAQNIGSGSLRFGTVFATTGTINTSDAREKVWRGGPDKAALRAANRIIGELGFFQWSDAVAEKGEDGARIHLGVRAQEVIRVMMEEGLEDEQPLDFAPDKFIAKKARPSFRNAFLCFDTWEAVSEPEMAETEVPVAIDTGLLRDDGMPMTRTVMKLEQKPTGKMIETRHAGNRFGLRIDQLTMFLLAALASRVATLEGSAS